MSAWYERIKEHYSKGRWKRQQVIDAVTRGAITEAEAKEILGE